MRKTAGENCRFGDPLIRGAKSADNRPRVSVHLGVDADRLQLVDQRSDSPCKRSARACGSTATPKRRYDNYISLFKNSRILETAHFGEAGAKATGRPKGSVMTIIFELEGQSFMALNGGRVFKFTPAISLMVECETQGELDELWEKLSDGGEEGQCGWLIDRFGISWQVVPACIGEMLKDPERYERVMAAVLQMTRLDIAALERAYADDSVGKRRFSTPSNPATS